MKSSSDVAELLFWLMQSSSENDITIALRYPNLVLKSPSQIQIIRTSNQMGSDKIRGTACG